MSPDNVEELRKEAAGLTDAELRGSADIPGFPLEIAAVLLDEVSARARAAMASRDMARASQLQATNDALYRTAHRLAHPEEPKFIPPMQSADPTRHLLGRA